MARIVIALGGNALGNTPEEQLRRIDEAAPSLIGLIKQGHEIMSAMATGPRSA
jgi:carbamate kinase